jgi:hypothetical protein
MLGEQSIYLPGTRKLRDAMRCMWGPLAGGLAPLTLRYGAAAASTWWTAGGTGCVGAWAAKGAASQAASYVNLAQPGTYDLTLGVAPTWNTATGWTFNGLTKYLLSSSAIPIAQTWSVLIKFNSVVGTGGVLCGTYSSDNLKQCTLTPAHPSVDVHVYNFSDKQKNPAARMTSGSLGVSGVTCYANGSPDATFTGMAAFTAAWKLAIGAKNFNNGTILDYLNGVITSCWIANTTQSDATMLAIHNAMP